MNEKAVVHSEVTSDNLQNEAYVLGNDQHRVSMVLHYKG